ncbi:MAG: DUF4244 domain-containing protein [Propionibacteriaceae bacterium]|jgi:hypothetical protein|nr:DUF4244 domain-containing protein [Propionibacteriaceae bacterium]
MSAIAKIRSSLRNTVKAVKSFISPDAGMTTAEYAVGTVGAIGLGSLIAYISQQEWFKELVKMLVEGIVNIIITMLGGQ